MQLSPSQQKDIEDSLWVVNSALKQQSLSNNEDLRQSAILYMCKCRLRFNPQKHIMWTTFAYRNVYLYIKRTINKERKKQSKIIDKDIFEMEDYFKVDKPKVNSIISYKLIADACNEEDIKILNLMKQGYSQIEIAEKLNCSQSKIYKRFKAIKEKIKGLKNIL
jgi:RNA polymerase sigma factor (sigma-70 family)